jgi:hypothetical protein
VDSQHILKEFERIQGYPPIIQEQWDDVFLLAHASDDEVLCLDPESIWIDGKMYTPYFPELERISHRAFSPSEIEESWGE